VQDTNLNRDFTQWRSAISVTINGMPSQNKDVRVDGINIVDEGGCGTAYVNLNMDAVGEVQVIANGYTAENGRNNGGVISMVTKRAPTSCARPPGTTAAATSSTRTTTFRKAANQAKPLYRVNISGYSVGGPVVIPGLVDSRRADSKKFYFFGLAGVHRRRAADFDDAGEHAHGARIQRRLLADAHHERHRPVDQGSDY
jgi:outer membrane receptor protein involved in Fe transport